MSHSDVRLPQAGAKWLSATDFFFYEITLLGVGGCISDPVGEEFRCRRPIHPLPERSTQQCRVASSRCYSGLASDC